MRVSALKLQDQHWGGTLAPFLGNLTFLMEINLTNINLHGEIPREIGHLKRLRIFNLRHNNLHGQIPVEMINCSSLEVILLSYNNLTGKAPSWFGSMIKITKLGLAVNGFVGDIPPSLGNLSSLQVLSLAYNYLEGTISQALGRLSNLTFLYLGANNFSGHVPPSFYNLSSIEVLSLSENQLVVPVGGLFKNITAISLTRNKDLCGGVPQLNLPPCPAMSKQKKHKRSIKKRVILSITFGEVLITSVTFISIYLLKKKAKKLSIKSLALQYGYVKVSYGELHHATNGFSLSNLVGTGNFGTVYKGTLVHFERPIAVKVLNLQTHGALKSFLAECRALGKIKHRNLVSILTCCSSVDYKGNDFKAIVFEFMPNGSLESLLHNTIEDGESANLSLNFVQRVNIALDVAFALDYLHNDSGEAIVHCDVKPSNVLLDDEVVAHLGDFGLARLIHGAASHSSSGQASSSTIKGTIGYIPPEYGGGGSVSREGDMYSYGVLLLEMLTAKKPTDSIFGEGLNLRNFCNMATTEGIIEIVDSRLLIPIDEQDQGRRVITRQQNMEDIVRECLVSFARIGIACSEESASQRMGIKNVIMELHAIKQKLLS
ncbi:hypothetical protein PIB30_008801 [Stylosanthes scabra]|uniref:Protein kinase domain-containing protein n=1 Tax=Stylosanthes scabra TaxID=79078 RepID=A0ABU6X6E9_9FABA|nr:hypothetical protein [Stylosanthes scabra]